MSNRTMLEFNHDFAPTKAHIETWGMCIAEYLRSGDPSSLPSGVTFFGMRHHTQPCPMGDPPRGWRNDEPQTEKAREMDYQEAKTFIEQDGESVVLDSNQMATVQEVLTAVTTLPGLWPQIRAWMMARNVEDPDTELKAVKDVLF